MADRIVVMRAGAIEQAGAGADIYRRPASRFGRVHRRRQPDPLRRRGEWRVAAAGAGPATRAAGDAPASGLALLRRKTCVTHDQEEATMADRIVVMRAGAIEQAGAGADIYRRPASRFGRVHRRRQPDPLRRRGEWRVAAAGAGPARDTRPATRRPAAWRCCPEDLRLAQDGPGADCALSGTVRDVINVGSHCMIHVDVDGQTLVARHGGAAPAGLRAGDAATLAFAATDLHLIGGQS